MSIDTDEDITEENIYILLEKFDVKEIFKCIFNSFNISFI